MRNAICARTQTSNARVGPLCISLYSVPLSSSPVSHISLSFNDIIGFPNKFRGWAHRRSRRSRIFALLRAGSRRNHTILQSQMYGFLLSELEEIKRKCESVLILKLHTFAQVIECDFLFQRCIDVFQDV